jgi:hypothetical protein
MPILDSVYRERLRANRVKTQAKGAADPDIQVLGSNRDPERYEFPHNGPQLVINLQAERKADVNASVPGRTGISRFATRSEQPKELPPEGPDDSSDPHDCTLLLLPPPSPEWSHLLCGRPHEAASALSARMALLAIGCRLGIHPSLNAFHEASRCRSAGAVRSLLVHVYGERGLAIAYQLAGREQPPRTTSDGVTNGDSKANPPELLSPEVLRSLPLPVARFFLYEPRTPPRWRTSRPPDGMDDGAWCG